MPRSIWSSLLTCLCVFFSLNLSHAEVEEVIVQWKAEECQHFCMNQLERQFEKIPGAEEIYMSPGKAVLKWRKQTPFHLSSIKVAMEVIGLYMTDLHVRVKGWVKHQGKTVTLVSSKDHLAFILVDSIEPPPSPLHSNVTPLSYCISSDLCKKLLDAESRQHKIVVEGMILHPNRTPPLPLTLMIDKIE